MTREEYITNLKSTFAVIELPQFVRTAQKSTPM